MTEQTNEQTAGLATLEGALNLRDLALIGTFGNAEAPAALVRMPGGAIRRIAVGDPVRQRTVVAIADGEVILARGSATEKLTMPGARKAG